MPPQNSERAAPGVSGNSPLETDRLGGAIFPRITKTFPRNQALRRLTAKLAALADWRDDIQSRIDQAIWLQERGAFFAIEQDNLIDAVKAWRLTAAAVMLDLDAGKREERRGA